MSQLVADFVLERLRGWGIRRVYGYPGDGINGFLGAFDRANGDPEFTQVRHEEMAAFMATAHAKYTGELGVCIATSGPGAVHLLNGLYDAKLDHQPVLAIVGQQKRPSLGAHYQQEIDLQTLFTDVSAFVNTCTHPAQARHLIDRGIRTALAERSVATIVFPDDVQESAAMPSPPRAHGSVFSSIGYTRPRVVPQEVDLERAAAILDESKKVAMLIGQGAAEAADEVVEIAELLGAGVAKALNGKAVLPDDLPFVTGPIGLLGSKPSFDLMMGCDCLLMVGTSFPYSEWLPKEGQARCIEIDIDATMIGIRYPADMHLVGDARDTLQALLPRVRRKEDRSWRDEIEQNVASWWRILDERAHEELEPMNPARVLWELSAALPDKAIVSADSGSSTNWFARDLRLRKGMKSALSGTLATMGAGVPYAIAAKFAYPERASVAIVGDGAFQMNGMNELLTVKHYWDSHLRRDGAALVICVFNNQDLNQVTWEQRVLGGDPRNPATQQIPDFPYAAYAELLGFKGIRCEDAESLADLWREALATDDRPVVLEVVTTREYPPLPPHITFQQAHEMAKALLKGDEDAMGIMQNSLRGKLAEFKESLRP